MFEMYCVTKSYLFTEGLSLPNSMGNNREIDKGGEDIFSTKMQNEMVDKLGKISGGLNELQKCEVRLKPFLLLENEVKPKE